MCLERLRGVVYALIRAWMQTMDGAHWPHMEFPDMFNDIMEEWLAGVGLKNEVGGAQLNGNEGKHVVSDEL
ncbi:hypothetical protein OG21DRAFT_1518214 [Imleria badia]|nr:hypothetical protein OG21DRAFT_1518214 [Imleria badia]